MDRTLIIETSTPNASIAIGSASGIEQRAFCSDRNHNALIFNPLRELLGEQPVTRILVGSGPGSYSGTRVGIAAAQGIGLALGCPVIAVPSILAVPSAADGRPCLAIGDARRGSFWTARMQGSVCIHEPRLCDAKELEQECLEAQAAGVPVIALEASNGFPPAVSAALRIEHPDASQLWQVWQAWDNTTRDHAATTIAQPIYLKPPHITIGKRPRLVP